MPRRLLPISSLLPVLVLTCSGLTAAHAQQSLSDPSAKGEKAEPSAQAGQTARPLPVDPVDPATGQITGPRIEQQATVEDVGGPEVEAPGTVSPAGGQPGISSEVTVQATSPVDPVPLPDVPEAVTRRLDEKHDAPVGVMLGRPIRDIAGEDVGTIRDVLIDIESGRVMYVLIEMAGAEDIDGKQIAVPWKAISASRLNEEIAVTMAASDLRNFPFFDDQGLQSAQAEEERR